MAQPDAFPASHQHQPCGKPSMTVAVAPHALYCDHSAPEGVYMGCMAKPTNPTPFIISPPIVEIIAPFPTDVQPRIASRSELRSPEHQ